MRDLPDDGLDAYLTEHSGLPGPRGNLELADAFAVTADSATILRLAESDDEYLRFCGTEAVGRLALEQPANPTLRLLLRERAGDPLWRVREAAARALQIVGDADPALMLALVTEWSADPSPLVRRAAIAGICEPRLLKSPQACAAALAACLNCTEWIAALPADGRRDPGVRTLRQALGYCWSVAIAADPGPGLAAFERMRAVADPDIRWIVRTNLTKARLRRLLEAREAPAPLSRPAVPGHPIATE
ncbi:hypothetical protein E3O44_16910 [Cryobacterium algoricola]|uniref:HEAT repeat domain-containing protein n=1 Tax=Cryobacterium algoricola TaxID=1259183 RepID=A0ABY2IBF2_9MICO|nr:hypothetical protein E3O44_16910 [Cryobacterium algoricola]